MRTQMITLRLIMIVIRVLELMWPSGSTAPPQAPPHLRFSSAYAWNVSSLPAASFNLAQASLGAVAPLAARGLPSALAGLQGTVFVRTSSTAQRLAVDWEAQLDQLAVKMRPLVRPGFIEAVFLGDEICCHCPSCLNATLAPVARRLRAFFPDPKVLPIWANECDSSIVGGIAHGGVVTPPLPQGQGAIPSEIDILSVDIYRGFGNDSLPGAVEVANVSSFFTKEVFPRMRETQRAMVVPGFFGCTNCIGKAHGCGSLVQQEARMLDKLSAYEQYLKSEPRMAGLAPWHMDNRKSAGCDVAVKPKCHDCDMKLGAASFPRLLAAWQTFGASIVRTQTQSRMVAGGATNGSHSEPPDREARDDGGVVS